MSEGLQQVHDAAEQVGPGSSARSRRQVVRGAAAALGGMGLVGALPATALGGTRAHAACDPGNSTQNILNIAATAEVLATIVNTIGWERRLGGDDVTQRNLAAAAREELVHYQVLKSLGAKEATKRIWVPDAVLANRSGLLSTLVAGDQIFVNAYLIGVGAFAKADPKLAAVPAEFMGVEAVHRALALQSLGQLGNDRIFMRVDFTSIGDAVTRLQQAGFGFGQPGAAPGAFYEFDQVKGRTPNDPDLNTPTPTPIDA
jgi:hypothetical protein